MKFCLKNINQMHKKQVFFSFRDIKAKLSSFGELYVGTTNRVLNVNRLIV